MHGDGDHTKRKMARFGMCHYPTVKFNIVGYPRRKTVFPDGIATSEFGTTQGGTSHGTIAHGLFPHRIPPLSYEGFVDLTDSSLLS